MPPGLAPVRTMLVWCPDWPVVAAGLADGLPADAPVAVMHANMVIACSAAARAAGVKRGLRKRDSQSRCPNLLLADHDPARDMRFFEPIAAAVEHLVAGAEIQRPGVLAFPAAGPSKYHGGELKAAELIIEHIAVQANAEACVGLADGPFAALRAARAGRVIDPGGTPAFLAPLPITELGRPKLTDLLIQLGIRTLGSFAALPHHQVFARFGIDGSLAHRQASGQDDRPLEIRTPPVDLSVTRTFDDPVRRVDIAAFITKAMAEQLHERLAGHSLACTRLIIGVRAEDGTEHERVWRHDGILAAQQIADRCRWQLDSWLTQGRLGGGLTMLQLAPDGIVPIAALQGGLWGEAGPERQRAVRAISRVQSILGPEGVLAPVLGGGRDERARLTFVPWGDERVPIRVDGPWPGGTIAPYAAVVPAEPIPVDVLDADGQRVLVDARLGRTGDPCWLAEAGGRSRIAWFSPPWPADERWWDPADAVRKVRLQVLLDDGRALLLAQSGGHWFTDFVYD